MMDSSIVITELRHSLLVRAGANMTALIINMPGDVDDILGNAYRHSIPAVVMRGISSVVRSSIKGSALLNAAGAVIPSIMLSMKNGLVELFYRSYNGSSFMSIIEKAIVNSRIVGWLT